MPGGHSLREALDGNTLRPGLEEAPTKGKESVKDSEASPPELGLPPTPLSTRVGVSMLPFASTCLS